MTDMTPVPTALIEALKEWIGLSGSSGAHLPPLHPARAIIACLPKPPPTFIICTLCDGRGCEEGCGDCEMSPTFAGPDAHKVCRRCNGRGFMTPAAPKETAP